MQETYWDSPPVTLAICPSCNNLVNPIVYPSIVGWTSIHGEMESPTILQCPLCNHQDEDTNWETDESYCKLNEKEVYT